MRAWAIASFAGAAILVVAAVVLLLRYRNATLEA